MRDAEFNPKVGAGHSPFRPICRDAHVGGAILMEFLGLIAKDRLLT